MSVRAVDPARSRIVLVGAPAYDDPALPDVPEVVRNLVDLAAVFTDPTLGGFLAEHCVTAGLGAAVDQVGDLLHEAAEQAEDLLLFYFAGHGLVGARGELYLALRGTRSHYPSYSALRFETVRDTFLDSAKAANRVVILDSCFSGRAIGRTLGGPSGETLADEVEINGTYTLTSAPPNGVALVREGEAHTAFTGRLISLLREGDGQAGELLTLGGIYRRLRVQLKAEGLPLPQQRGTATADLLGLVRNIRPAPVQPTPQSVEILAGPGSGPRRDRRDETAELGDWRQDSEPEHLLAAHSASQSVDRDKPQVAEAARQSAQSPPRTLTNGSRPGGNRADELEAESSAGSVVIAGIVGGHTSSSYADGPAASTDTSDIDAQYADNTTPGTIDRPDAALDAPLPDPGTPQIGATASLILPGNPDFDRALVDGPETQPFAPRFTARPVEPGTLPASAISQGAQPPSANRLAHSPTVEARALIAVGHVDAAERVLNKAFETGNGEAGILLADIARRLGDRHRERVLIDQVTELILRQAGPDWRAARSALLRHYRSQNREDDVERFLGAQAELEDPEGKLHLARYLFGKGERTKAITLLELAAVNGSSEAAHLLAESSPAEELHTLLRRMGQRDSSQQRQADTSADISPPQPFATRAEQWLRRGRRERDKGTLREARILLQRAADAGSPQAAAELRDLLKLMGQR